MPFQLDTPFRYKDLHLANRVVMAPMTRSNSKNHIPGQLQADYYRKRAEGGVGLIISEGTSVGHPASHAFPNVPFFYGEKALEGWALVLKQVHEAKGKMFPQLWHVGSVRQTNACCNQGADHPKAGCCFENNVRGIAPSPISHPYVKGGEIPQEMSKKDIEAVIEAFARAALDAKMIGFDGIEIHAAHGYLIDQFFWDRTNRRTDEYGGKTLEQRTRFAVEIVEAIRNKVGSDFPIDLRFSQWKLGDYEAKLACSPKELETFLIPLVKAGVDIFHCSTRRFWQPEFPDSSLNLAGWTKKITGKTTISVGSVGLDIDFITGLNEVTHSTLQHLNELAQRLENEEFDLIAIGRALLADPFWLEKVNQRKFSEIVPFSKEMLTVS